MPQLIVFEAVARLGTVTRAADELHLAQPTVSQQLKKLAQTLEVTLFEQDGRRLRMTGAGHELREICGEVMGCLERAEARLAAWRVPKAQTLTLAAEPSARHVAARLLADFCAAHPGVQGSLFVDDRVRLIARFGEARDDIYLFELDSEVPLGAGRWTVTPARGRELAKSAAQFFREALLTETLR